MASTSDYIKSMYLDPKNDNDQYLILKRKKKRKAITDVRNVNIYDDDINLNEIKLNEDDEKYALKEERPAIDENVKDNSRLIKNLSSWKQIEIKNRSKYSESDDDYDLSNLRNKKNDKKRNNDSDEDLNIRRKRDSSSSDLEIDRRKKISESDSDLDIRNRRKESPENRSRERRREYSNRERYEPIRNESRQHKRYNLDKEELRKKNDNYRDKSRRESKDQSPKVFKTNEIRRDNLDEDYNRDRRIKKSRHSIDNETNKYNHHHHKKRKNRQSIESNDSNHHRKSKKNKSEDDSPKVIKINEIKNSSDEEDIREKIKNLYKEDGPNLEKLKEKNEIDHKYKQWSKGMKQIDDRKKQLEEEEYEMSKPLARYKDDEDLDRHLRDQELIDDPMLEYFRKRKKEQDQQKQLEETGEVWIMPKYESKLPPPINRYNILPGYRWDGVDRGNGFEIKLLSKKAEKLANQEEAYKYSTSDM